MKETLGAIGILIAVIVFCYACLYTAVTLRETNVDKDCSNRFGQGWHGRFGLYSGSRCVNDDGEAKYL